MGRPTDIHQNKHHFRDNLIPESNEGLDVGVTGQRFNTGRFKTVIADVGTFLTASFGALTSVIITVGLQLSFLTAGYLKTDAGGNVGVQAVPIPIADGGSGSTSLAAGAVISNGAVLSTETLAVARGGTGAATLAAHGILLGEGTSAVTPMTALTKGQLVVGQTSADPTALAVSTDGFVLTLDSAQAAGVKWAASAGGAGFMPIANQVFGG